MDSMVLIQKTNDFAKIREIRTEIFNIEMGLSNSDIFDEDDKMLDQFLIINEGKAVGTFRLRETGIFHKIERMGILSKYRGKGFGKSALEQIKTYSKKVGKTKIILDSIFTTRLFYAKSGFTQTGETYDKVGIPHVKMHLELK